jgi:hypothetical protein
VLKVEFLGCFESPGQDGFLEPGTTFHDVLTIFLVFVDFRVMNTSGYDVLLNLIFGNIVINSVDSSSSYVELGCRIVLFGTSDVEELTFARKRKIRRDE